MADPVGVIEIAERLSVTRDAVNQWRRRDVGFPEPRWTVGGRPAWGKRSFLSAAELAPRYPRWDDFQAIRAAFDPDGRFANPWTRHVLG